MAYKAKKKKQKETKKRELPFKEHGTEYCKVIKMLGNARLEGDCFDGKKRLCIIRGNMSKRRKVWIKVGDIILVGLRDFQDDKADVLLKYSDEEVRQLKLYDEIPKEVTVGIEVEENEDDIGVDFNYEDDFDNI